MIKCEVTKEFTYKDYDKLKNIQRRRIDTKGKLYIGDTFECDKETADYLMGDNKDGAIVVKVIEIEPEKEIIDLMKDPYEDYEEPKPKKRKKVSE